VRIAVPLPVTVTPPPEVASSVPDDTARVAVTAPDPASTSPKPKPKTGDTTSSVTVSVGVTVTTGVSFTGSTVRTVVVAACSEVAVPVRPGSRPVWPPSSTTIVSVSLAVASAAVVKVSAPDATKAFTSATVPTRVRAPAVPPTVTPAALVPSSEPEATDTVTVTVDDPASTSEIDRPVSGEGASSVTAIEPGTATDGASFTAVTSMVTSAVDASSDGPPVVPGSAPVNPLSTARMFRFTSASSLVAVANRTCEPAMKAVRSPAVP
jgi:hypothetical protein